MFRQSLTAFMAVVEKGSISKAADSLFVSPPAVKKQIDQLEQELGFQLLTRSNRGTKLTRAGESFYQDLHYLKGYIDHAVEAARQIASDEYCSIRVGTSLFSPCTSLLEIWNQIGEKYPKYRLSIVSFNDDAENMKRIFRTIGQDFDIMVRICDVINWKSHFRFLELGKSKICLFVPRSHRLASKERIRPEDLYGEKVAIIREGTSALIDEVGAFLRTEHPRIRIETKVPHYDIELFNQCASENVPLIAADVWTGVHPYMVAIPVDWEFTMPFGLTYPLHPTKEVESFIEIIREYAREEKKC